MCKRGKEIGVASIVVINAGIIAKGIQVIEAGPVYPFCIGQRKRICCVGVE